jgi:hypothetical protein
MCRIAVGLLQNYIAKLRTATQNPNQGVFTNCKTPTKLLRYTQLQVLRSSSRAPDGSGVPRGAFQLCLVYAMDEA